jgi:NAD(P)-dependent dehydrogenase (short-subunit alcohol dehydrogenase family)
VNNAGIDRNAAGEEMSDEDWRAVMAVNLDGTFYSCREVGRHMLERGRGVIVNIASMSGLVSNHPSASTRSRPATPPQPSSSR